MAAQALGAEAALLTAVDDPESRDEVVLRTRTAIDALRSAPRNLWHEVGEDRFTAAAIVTALERVTGGRAR